MIDDANDVRLDVWLDVACLFKTRSEAQTACKSGKVDVNGQSAKPNRHMRIGDEIEIKRPYGRKQRVTVRRIRIEITGADHQVLWIRSLNDQQAAGVEGALDLVQ